jgi:hypothetical protein
MFSLKIYEGRGWNSVRKRSLLLRTDSRQAWIPRTAYSLEKHREWWVKGMA